MTSYLMSSEVEDGEIETILKEMEAAQEKIYECYGKLRDLGVVVVRKADSQKADGQGGG